jgi:hypothetical protein
MASFLHLPEPVLFYTVVDVSILPSVFIFLSKKDPVESTFYAFLMKLKHKHQVTYDETLFLHDL